MRRKTMLLSPKGLTTASLVVVADLRFEDAHIALRKFFHAGKTITLSKLLLILRPQCGQEICPLN